MSTMYDALRKAEAERSKTAGPAPVKTGPSAEGIMDTVKVVGLLIAVIVVFIIAFNRIKGSWQMPAKSAAVVQTAGAVKGSSVPGANIQSPAYTLDGVIDAGDNSLAIINGKSLRLEDKVDGLILKKISPKEVELLNTKDNSTVVLKIE